jgi:hypothetical protein
VVFDMATDLAMMSLDVRNARGWKNPDDEPLKNEIADLAMKFGDLVGAVDGEEPLDESSTENLVEALNAFNVLRLEIIERRERLGLPAGERLVTGGEMVAGELDIIDIMHSRYTWNRIDKAHLDDLIPGLKAVLGHDINGKAQREVQYFLQSIDTGRSSECNDEGKTKANFYRISREYLELDRFTNGVKGMYCWESTIERDEPRATAEKMLEEVLHSNGSKQRSVSPASDAVLSDGENRLFVEEARGLGADEINEKVVATPQRDGVGVLRGVVKAGTAGVTVREASQQTQTLPPAKTEQGLKGL